MSNIESSTSSVNDWTVVYSAFAVPTSAYAVTAPTVTADWGAVWVV